MPRRVLSYVRDRRDTVYDAYMDPLDENPSRVLLDHGHHQDLLLSILRCIVPGFVHPSRPQYVPKDTGGSSTGLDLDAP